MSETTTGGGNAVLKTIELVTQIAVQSNVAVATIFGLIKAVRDNWPHKAGDPVIPDDVLIATMKAEFDKNSTRNAELIAAIVAGNPTPPAA
jgi:hypothetical protein